MRKWVWVLVGLSTANMLAACGDDDGSSGGASGGSTSGGGTGASGGTGGGTGASGGTAGSGGNTGGTAGAVSDSSSSVDISGQIVEFQEATPDAGAPVPVDGVQICVKDSTICATTDATGHYALNGVPTGIETALLATKAGYANIAVAGVFSFVNGTLNFSVPNIGLTQTYSLAAGFTWPYNGKGVIVANVPQGGTLSITPTTSVVGPVYFDDQDFPDPSLTSSSTLGNGAFGDLAPAEYTVKAAKSGVTCTRGNFGWPASNPDEARVPVLPDYIVTLVLFNCN